MHHYTRWLLRLGVPALISLLLLLLPQRHVCPNQWAVYNASLAAYNAPNSTADDPSSVAPLFVCAGAGADNALVPVFAIGGALWAVYFLKYWRRYAACPLVECPSSNTPPHHAYSPRPHQTRLLTTPPRHASSPPVPLPCPLALHGRYQSELVFRWDVSDFQEVPNLPRSPTSHQPLTPIISHLRRPSSTLSRRSPPAPSSTATLQRAMTAPASTTAARVSCPLARTTRPTSRRARAQRASARRSPSLLSSCSSSSLVHSLLTALGSPPLLCPPLLTAIRDTWQALSASLPCASP